MTEHKTDYDNYTDVVLIGVYRRCIEIGADAADEKAQVEQALVARGLDLTLAGNPEVSVMDERLVSQKAREQSLGL